MRSQATKLLLLMSRNLLSRSLPMLITKIAVVAAIGEKIYLECGQGDSLPALSPKLHSEEVPRCEQLLRITNSIR